jgi:hypothetical protein
VELNSVALSYENAIEHCDWVMLENCGLTVDKANWAAGEPEAMLQKAIARNKSDGKTPTLALSYYLYKDGAYLGWAIARFWGVTNWSSTHSTGVNDDPGDLKEEADLIGPLNRWESAHPDLGTRCDITEVRLVFLRAVRDNGWRDDRGLGHWERVRRWSLALLDRNIGYRFVLSSELEEEKFLAEDSPLILDGCAHLTERQATLIERFLRRGGRVWIVPPLGIGDAQGQVRSVSLLDRLLGDKTLKHSFTLIDPNWESARVADLVERELSPLIRVEDPGNVWAIRPRRQGSTMSLHILNRCLRGQAHPTVTVRGGKADILKTFSSQAWSGPLVVEVDECSNVTWARPTLISPELDSPRSIKMERTCDGKIRLTISTEGIRLYAQVLSHSKYKS